MAEPLPTLKQRFFDANGDPLSGGKFYSYLAGTTVPAATYAENTGTVPNTNPVILDANGEADIFIGAGSYKFVLADADDVVQWTKDNVSAGTPEMQSAWVEHAFTADQSATELEGESIDFDQHSSAIYDVEIKRGADVAVNGPAAIQSIGGVARWVMGALLTEEAHGITFSFNQVGNVATLRAADTLPGLGNGTIKLTRRLVPKSST